MKIKSVEPFVLHVPVTGSQIADSTHTLTHWGVVGARIETEEGLVGGAAYEAHRQKSDGSFVMELGGAWNRGGTRDECSSRCGLPRLDRRCRRDHRVEHRRGFAARIARTPAEHRRRVSSTLTTAFAFEVTSGSRALRA